MSILTQVCEKMREILHTPADEAALRCGFVKRKRKLTGSAFVKTLVFGWLEAPDASYADLSQTARAFDVDITRQAIEQRMTVEAAETLKATLEAAATQVPYPRTAIAPVVEAVHGCLCARQHMDCSPR